MPIPMYNYELIIVMFLVECHVCLIQGFVRVNSNSWCHSELYIEMKHIWNGLIDHTCHSDWYIITISLYIANAFEWINGSVRNSCNLTLVVVNYIPLKYLCVVDIGTIFTHRPN